mgnify:CR=1 FL=1
MIRPCDVAFDATAPICIAAQEKRRHHDGDGESRPGVCDAQLSKARVLAAKAVIELLVEFEPVRIGVARQQEVEETTHVSIP